MKCQMNNKEREEIKMEKEKSIEELERESAEIRLKIDKAMEKSMKEMKKADILFNITQVVLLVLFIVAIASIINKIRVDNELLETYDSCVDVNGERYCRVED